MHTQEQLNGIWDRVISGEQQSVADTVRPLAGSPHDVLPVVACNDHIAQVLSIPINDNVARAVYARKPGGSWVELQ